MSYQFVSKKMETQKAHQIFYKERDYDSQIRRYRRQEKQQYSQEELLVLAKAYFIDQEYENCLEILKNIDPKHNTKVLFERQSLLFRATYLLKRTEKPSAKDVADLYEIIAQFQSLKLKVPGESFKKRHLQILQGYRNFVVFLQKYSSSSITYNQTLFTEQERADRLTHKLSGFPCFLISQQWLEDYRKMKQQLERQSGKAYLGPITNFALVNDIFETHVFEHEPQIYKNVYIFPTSKFKVVSKKLWSFYTGVFSPENQFCPVKRLFQEKSYSQYNAGANSNIVPLVPVLIQCQKKRTIIQLTSNYLVSNELLPLIEQKYGTGELKNPYNQQNSFDFFYFGQRSQKLLSDWGKTLIFQKKKLPDHLKNYKIFNYLQYNPIPQTCMLNKEGGLKGLENLGNSCYLNSVVQCLSFTRQIAQNLTTKDITPVILSKKQQGDGTVTLAFSDLLKQLWRETQAKSVSPHKFKKFFGIKNTMFAQRTQEDAHQFLLHLLNSIHEDLKRGSVRVARSLSKLQVTTNVQDVKRYFQKHQLQENRSLITQLMRGIYHTTILCKNCETTSHSFDLFLALSIPVPYISYPQIRFYYVPWKGRITSKYELTLKNVKTVNQLFEIFQKEVIDVKTESKNDVKITEQSSPERTQTTKRNYILMAFSRQSQPEQLWNYCSQNTLTKKQIQLNTLLQSKKDLIFYQVQVLMGQRQLVLVEYKYKQMFSNEKAIGIPKFLVLPEELIRGKEASKFKRIIVENNFEDRLYEQDFEEIKSYEWKNKPLQTFKFSLTAYFRKVEKMFLETNYIDKELNSASEAYDIRDCLRQMSKPDILEGWKCGHCNHSKVAEKVQHITQTNHILIISMKRFQANGTIIRNMINYPLQKLDMKEWLEDKNGLGSHLYDLYGVCFHSGTMQFGHYRAYCKHFITGEWYEFDDERVRKIDASDVVTSQAYMLFYKRRDI